MSATGDHLGAGTEMVDVLVGYLVTHQDGYQARVGPDRTARPKR